MSEHAGDIKSLSSTLARLDIASSLALVAHDRVQKILTVVLLQASIMS